MCGRIPREWNRLHRQVVRGSAKGLCGLRGLTGPQELVPATAGDLCDTEQMSVPRNRKQALHGWGMLVWDGQAIASVFYTQLHCS